MKKVIMKRVVLILFLVLSVPNGNLFLQEIPDCMCMPYSYPPHNPEYFLDSAIIFDTCGIQFKHMDCDSSLFINYFKIYDDRERIFAKRLWLLWFDVKAFDLPSYDPDTLIELTWRNVDSVNFQEIKDSLKNIENNFGNYKLIKKNPQYTEPYIGQLFLLHFENYVNGVTIEDKFNSIPFASCDFLTGISKEAGTGILSIVNNNLISIYPNPANEYIEIYFDRCPTSDRCRTSEIIEIYNVLGEKVKTPIPNALNPNPQFRVDVSDLPNGIYFVRIGNIYQSFVKN